MTISNRGVAQTLVAQAPLSQGLAPKTQAAVDEFAKKLAELLLEEGVELDELVRIDERVLPLVRRIGNKALEELAKKKVDSTVKQNEELGLKVHRSKTILFEYIFGAVAIESPYMWLKECGGIRPTSELLGLNARWRSELVTRALTSGEESFGRISGFKSTTVGPSGERHLRGRG